MDWERCRLVVFDVDGTLYSQGRLRRQMVPRLLAAAAGRGSPKLLSVVAALRRERERLGEAQTPGFEQELFANVARACGVSATEAERVLRVWLEERPLPYLRRCRVRGAPELFDALHRSGRSIGVLSDYAAHAKLAALGLAADHVVSATDPDVQVLKPDPKGLAKLMERAGCAASQTVMIGDRDERDGEIARRLGVPYLIRRRASAPAAPHTFQHFAEPLFAPVLGVPKLAAA